MCPAHVDIIFETVCCSVMSNRSTVSISITPEHDSFLQSRVESGRYQSTSEVVREALSLLERQEQDRDEAILQLKADLQIGIDQADRGELIDGAQAFETLRLMIEEQRLAKNCN